MVDRFSVNVEGIRLGEFGIVLGDEEMNDPRVQVDEVAIPLQVEAARLSFFDEIVHQRCCCCRLTQRVKGTDEKWCKNCGNSKYTKTLSYRISQEAAVLWTRKGYGMGGGDYYKVFPEGISTWK